MSIAVVALLFFTSLIFLYSIYQYIQLSHCLAKIKSDIDTANGLIDYQEDGVESFYRDYEEINDSFKSIPYLAHAWQEFTEHINFAKNNEGELVVKNSIQPSSYFSVFNLITKNTKIKRSNNVAWNLLGFGVVGAVVIFALSMLNLPAAFEQTLTLMKVMQDASYALVCFAAGLGHALVFAMLQKKDIAHVEDKLHEFNQNLESVVVFSTANQILNEVLNVLIEQNKKVDGVSNSIVLNHRSLSEMLAVRKQQNDELLQNLTENFSDKLQQIVEQIQSNITMLTELNTTFPEHSQNFSDKLQQLVEQGQRVAATLDELKQHSSANVDKFSDKLQQLFTQQEQHTTIALERLRESNITGTEKLYERLGELPAAQEQFNYELQATLKKQPRENYDHEDHKDCGSENADNKKSRSANTEDNKIDELMPLERVS